MNYRENIYRIWAPADSPWSTWAKPVLFAHLPAAQQTQDEPLPIIDVPWAPSLTRSTAIVLDLPGEQSVITAITLARLGYRPVPLFNAVPGPMIFESSGQSTAAMNVVVNLWPTFRAIENASTTLQSLNLAPDAPPAFLLDSARRTGRPSFVGPGAFDNRSISFPTDFPSSGFLLSQGIKAIVLIQPELAKPQPDLAHTLLAWQNSGLEIFASTLESATTEKIQIPKPSRFGSLWYQLLETLKLRRSPLGGFGGMLAPPSSG